MRAGAPLLRETRASLLQARGLGLLRSLAFEGAWGFLASGAWLGLLRSLAFGGRGASLLQTHGSDCFAPSPWETAESAVQARFRFASPRSRAFALWRKSDPNPLTCKHDAAFGQTFSALLIAFVNIIPYITKM